MTKCQIEFAGPTAPRDGSLEIVDDAEKTHVESEDRKSFWFSNASRVLTRKNEC